MDTQQLESMVLRRPHSPPRVRLAGDYFFQGRIEDVAQLCRTALRQFPQYATAYLFLAKYFAKNEDYISALVHLQDAIQAFPDSPLLQKLFAEWKEKAVQQKFLLAQVSVPAVHEASQPQEKELNVVQVESDPPVSITVQSIEQGSPDFTPEAASPVTESIPVANFASPQFRQADSKQMFEALSQPRINEQWMPVEEGRIVSKTLAEIYATQGAYQEALLTYRLLKQQRPSHKDEFDQRIKELELKLLSKPV